MAQCACGVFLAGQSEKCEFCESLFDTKELLPELRGAFGDEVATDVDLILAYLNGDVNYESYDGLRQDLVRASAKVLRIAKALERKSMEVIQVMSE